MGQRAQSVAVDMRGRYVDQKRKSDNFAYLRKSDNLPYAGTWAKWIAIMVTVLASYAAGYRGRSDFTICPNGGKWTATLYLR